jgi:hypothetical protein
LIDDWQEKMLKSGHADQCHAFMDRALESIRMGEPFDEPVETHDGGTTNVLFDWSAGLLGIHTRWSACWCSWSVARYSATTEAIQHEDKMLEAMGRGYKPSEEELVNLYDEKCGARDWFYIVGGVHNLDITPTEHEELDLYLLLVSRPPCRSP